MSRWFRFYDDAINDPKILKLSDKTFRVWTGLLCLASKNDGKLPLFEDMAIMLRMKPEKLQPELEALVASGLIDHGDDGMQPHNWNGRQYKSDSSNERVKRHRQRACNVTVTPPETEQKQITETEQKTEANASGAVAPRDVRTVLFSDGLETLARITGKTPNACRSFVGKCLKACDDNAITVLGLIEEADRNRIADPAAWIVASLKSTGPPFAKPLSRHDQDRTKLGNIIDGLSNFATGSSRSGQENSRLLRHDSSERPGGIRSGLGADVDDISVSSYRASG